MNIRYGVAETVGLRTQMEDAHAVFNEDEWGLFSAEVYDGHGGSLAAMIAAEVLTRNFLRHGKVRGESTPGGRQFTAEALHDAYLETDRRIVDQGTDSGTAAATLHLFPGGRLLAGNAGDVRIVIGEGKGAVDLTLDHRPDLPEERTRIEALGGKVITLDVARVQGSLAMSRALGDVFLKPLVTAEPRIAEGFLGRKNDLAVIASDGLWNVLTSEEAITMARSSAQPEEAANLLRASAMERGSTDNITVIVLDLKSYTARFESDSLRISRVLDRANELPDHSV